MKGTEPEKIISTQIVQGSGAGGYICPTKVIALTNEGRILQKIKGESWRDITPRDLLDKK